MKSFASAGGPMKKKHESMLIIIDNWKLQYIKQHAVQDGKLVLSSGL